MNASDAAGPYFNKLQPEDPTRHMTRESASTVINIKTSSLAGSGRPEWAHQTQYIGLCGSAQDQCPGRGKKSSGGCDHMLSMYYTKSSMHKNFPLISLRECSECPYKSAISEPSDEQCKGELDNLGWQSKGKPGIFVIKTLPVCLNLTLDVDLG
ncbi:uncharacterized protein LOC113367956 [Ctenocephalides felis]|uniref:uncharacterized protein LOC113367956 n=1 Tax=Ctenocephalides felis TaxID=7515 RepID=UPI000E6E5717|nr:uncharacterized protein LOC113367956 [Ctenocephalides felis]